MKWELLGKRFKSTVGINALGKKVGRGVGFTDLWSPVQLVEGRENLGCLWRGKARIRY